MVAVAAAAVKATCVYECVGGGGVRLYFCWEGNIVIAAEGCLLVCLNSEWAMTEKVSGGGGRGG